MRRPFKNCFARVWFLFDSVTDESGRNRRNIFPFDAFWLIRESLHFFKIGNRSRTTTKTLKRFRLLIFQEQSSSQGIEPNGENLVFIDIISRNLGIAKLTINESTGDTIVFSEG